MTVKYDTKFSGTKQEFASGATRDTATGKGKYVLVPPIALKRLAGVYERGAANHGDRNWEKGFPLSRGLDSAIRHIFQYIEGMRDEDHLAQAAWNLFAIMHFEEMIERGRLPGELDDLPNYMPQEKDYLLEPENAEISAGSAEDIEKKLKASLSMPINAGRKALEETDKLIAQHEKTIDQYVEMIKEEPIDKPGRAWKDFVWKRLTEEEEVDFRHWCCGQGVDLDHVDYERLSYEFDLWEASARQQRFVHPYESIDGYGCRTLFGSIVGGGRRYG